MWYFAWILGVLLACAVGIINVMWYEMEQHQDNIADDQQPIADLDRHNSTESNLG